jgi:hypothetical protein
VGPVHDFKAVVPRTADRYLAHAAHDKGTDEPDSFFAHHGIVRTLRGGGAATGLQLLVCFSGAPRPGW